VNATEIKAAIRTWILDRHPNYDAGKLTDETPLIEERLLTSIQVMDLVLFLEDLTGQAVDVTRLQKGAFSTLEAIRQAFFLGASA